MKVGKVKTKIISKPFLFKDDGLFDINICPCCGNSLGKVSPHRYTKEGLFYDTIYRKCEELKCPECGATFSKKILDRRVPHNIIENCFVISVLATICSPILGVIFMCFCLKNLAAIFFLLMIPFGILAFIFASLKDN